MRYRIGEFAALCGLSPKTLRFYGTIGLLVPTGRSQLSGYRYYEANQLRDAATIRNLTAFGMSLKQVARFLRQSPEEQKIALEHLRSEAFDTISVIQERLRWISAALRDYERNHDRIAVTLRRAEPIRIASIKAKLNDYNEIDELEAELKARIDAELIGSQRGVIWHRCGRGDLVGEAYVEIVAHSQRIAGIQIRELEGSSLAIAYSANDVAAAVPVYEALDRWLHDRKRVLTGPKREVYRAELIEIQFPINS